MTKHSVAKKRGLEGKQKQLAAAQAKVKEITDKVLALREKYDESTAYKEKLKQVT